MIKKIFYLCAGLLLILLTCGAGAFLWLVVFNPGPEIRQENIEKILAMETPVYYRNGRERIGVFFKDAHRQYIPYENIPKPFINAIVAAEDHNFFKHHGVDLLGIARAMLTNIRAGRIVQGGSTITQQTAKNLFKRKDRSIKSKLKELLFALRLEYHYPKEKIIEFYANQFYVSGNGHGLEMAARYYFDKPAGELNTLECAFIAGSVKRPNYYNPFTKKSEQASTLAKTRAKERSRYVLKQMNRLGMLDSFEYQGLLDREISFQQGSMFYSLNTLMDLVKEALGSPEIVDALEMNGIENVATSGIRIFTTVDHDLQKSTLFALRKELSRLDTRLRGYEREEVQNSYAGLPGEATQEVQQNAFLFGRVIEIDRTTPQVKVSFSRGGKTIGSGRLDKTGLMSFLTSLVKWQRQRWSEALSADLDILLASLEVGDLVYVSVREVDPLSGEAVLDLEKYPEIQGGALVMRDGEIRAMAGGMDNTFYNRAISAKRSMGSVMKPLVYAAAIQLGWNSTDPLNNSRDVFIYQNRPYFPRPDHASPHGQVSMNWAGVHSENVATVWLLYQLCDKLSPAEFKELAENLDLARRPDEPYQYYKRRMRDEFGILVDRQTLYQTAFRSAVNQLGPDLIFDGKLAEFETIKGLHYGTDFDTFMAETEELRDEEYEELSSAGKLLVDQEIMVRQDVLRNNFISLQELNRELALLEKRTFDASPPPEPLGRLYYDRQARQFSYSAPSPAEQDLREVSPLELDQILAALTGSAREKFWQSILVGGKLSRSTLESLDSLTEKELDQLLSLPPYSPEVLYSIKDFRVLAGLKYLTTLGRTLGVKSELEPVLSFPLGSNVITLFEAARIYEGLTSGRITINENEGEYAEGFAIIDRIEDSDGELIFQPEKKQRTVFDPKTVLAVNNILRNVVKFGTGRAANNRIRIHSREPETEEQLRLLDLQVPVLGKTGTANRFTNAAFVGQLPEVAGKANALAAENGFTVAAYVGFDDNIPMQHRSTHVTGASGALPVWIRMAEAILFEKEYGDRLDLVEISFGGNDSGRPTVKLLDPELGQVEVAVNQGNGIFNPKLNKKTARKNSTIITFGSITENGEFEPARNFQPFWKNSAPANNW